LTGRIVVTGVGVVSPLGVGREVFWHGLKAGLDGIVDISIFDTSNLPCHKAGQVKDFFPEQSLGRKGLKYLDRCAQLLGVATGLALADAGLSIQPADNSATGLVVGTAFGGLNSICRFDQQALTQGPHYVNPMDFPNTVINSAAGQTAIRYGLVGLNATITAGCTSSLHAIKYGVDSIRTGQAAIVLAGGVEELNFALYLGFCKLGILSGSRQGQVERVAPFDAHRNGLILGEGAALIVLETLEGARARNAKVYAEVLGFGNCHDERHPCRDSRGEAGASRAMRLALQDAGVDSQDVDFICAGASGSLLGDEIEANSIRSVFGHHPRRIGIHAPKSAIGESLGASGAFQVASSIMSLTEGIIPPTLNFTECPLGWRVEGLSREAAEHHGALAIVNSFGCDGNNASLVVSCRNLL
jgi:3-oxoacyl-[acyl-carrier-protein] synthase II